MCGTFTVHSGVDLSNVYPVPLTVFYYFYFVNICRVSLYFFSNIFASPYTIYYFRSCCFLLFYQKAREHPDVSYARTEVVYFKVLHEKLLLDN